jgi:hypothetical protein
MDSEQFERLKQLGYLGGAGTSRAPGAPRETAAHAVCNHAPCRCSVAVGQDFCCEACGQAAEAGSDVCACGHAECDAH